MSQTVTSPKPGTTSTGAALVADPLSGPSMLIPNGKGKAFKLETVGFKLDSAGPPMKPIAGTDQGLYVLKFNTWFGPDDDRMVPGISGIAPHDHPWTVFRSTVLSGSLTERRWRFNPETQEWTETVHTYRQGESYLCSGDDFHLVTAVADAVTQMECGPLKPANGENPAGRWGYRSPQEGMAVYHAAKPPREFLEALNTLNPWRPIQERIKADYEELMASRLGKSAGQVVIGRAEPI